MFERMMIPMDVGTFVAPGCGYSKIGGASARTGHGVPPPPKVESLLHAVASATAADAAASVRARKCETYTFKLFCPGRDSNPHSLAATGT